MTGHNRRKGYWQYYETAKETEQSHLKETLIDIIQEIPCPREKKAAGAGPDSFQAEAGLCLLLMMADNNTYRGIESDLRYMQTPWNTSRPGSHHAGQTHADDTERLA